MSKADYGIDAPGVIRNLFIAGACGFLVPLIFPVIRIGDVSIITAGFIWMGISCTFMGAWMLVYSTYGKMRHRDRMLSLVEWKGNENVLDIGTGRGLLMIGAAKKLVSGRSTGIDIWNAEDLSRNSMENTLMNAKAEGVGDKVEVLNENATRMKFADKSFNIIFSNLCLHNIYEREGRRKACLEISRVLTDGGSAIISDFKHIREYRNVFKEAGLDTKIYPGSYLTTFPPLSILKATKI
jgi:arsenite methyltransferase